MTTEIAPARSQNAPQSKTVNGYSNVLDDALVRVQSLDPALAATLSREVDALRDGRRFGLVFEKHLPESVRLPNHPIKRGVKVALRSPAKGEESTRWRVARVTTADGVRIASLVTEAGDDTTGALRPVAELVVVRDFGEPVYPGLRSIGRVSGPAADPEASVHGVINGENYHVLQALRYTHRKAVDLIYIDPPYNTGNEGWIYNDRYVAEQDAFKHSKWLSFMERRLVIARELLKDTGAIIVAIGDDEHHRLRMLMDQVFGDQNFIANVVWEGVRKNNTGFVSASIDYMLLYGRDRELLKRLNGRWTEPKPGVAEVVAEAAAQWRAAAVNGLAGADAAEQATKGLRSWWRSLSAGHPSKTNPGLAAYDQVDSFPGLEGMPFRALPAGNPARRPNLMYEVVHPVEQRPVPMPANGWRWTEEEFRRRARAGLILWGKTANTVPTYKRHLTIDDEQLAGPVFNKDRAAASGRLRDMFGGDRFPFPKDHEVLMRWIRMAAPKNAVVLDFFGGSGTTTEAVLRLNAEDGGTRQSILVTNNEVAARDAKTLAKAGYHSGDPTWEAKGIFEYVTRPRISTVVTGKRSTEWGLDGSTYSEGLPGCVEFFELTYLDSDRVSRAREFEAIAPLLWLKAGGVGACIRKEPGAGWAVTDRYAVLTDVDESVPFVRALIDADEPPRHVFVVTDSDADFEDIAASVAKAAPSGVTTRLYESYLRNFEINTEGA